MEISNQKLYRLMDGLGFAESTIGTKYIREAVEAAANIDRIMMTKNTVPENRARQVYNYGMYMNEGRRTRTLFPINISTVIDGGTETTFVSAGSGKEEAVEEAAATRRVVDADGRMFRTGKHG